MLRRVSRGGLIVMVKHLVQLAGCCALLAVGHAAFAQSAPKPAATKPTSVKPAKPAEPPAIPARTAKSSGFPYAQTSLFFATLFMFISLYFLLTNENTAAAPAQRPRRILARR